jgi:hypothetical protein
VLLGDTPGNPLQESIVYVLVTIALAVRAWLKHRRAADELEDEPTPTPSSRRRKAPATKAPATKRRPATSSASRVKRIAVSEQLAPVP